MTRTTAKNRINAILRDTTKGLFSDDCWQPVNQAWRVLRQHGFEAQVTNTRYGHDANSNPSEKVWFFEIPFEGKKPFQGVLTAHGAGTVEDPLSRYDISAYVS
jgi:hypothetical protein